MPAYRSTGKSVAQRLTATYQGGLIDFSQNTKGTKDKYALLLANVYTREIRAVPLLNMRPETVNAAMRGVMPEFASDKQRRKDILVAGQTSEAASFEQMWLYRR